MRRKSAVRQFLYDLAGSVLSGCIIALFLWAWMYVLLKLFGATYVAS